MRKWPMAIIDMFLLKWQKFIISVGGTAPVLSVSFLVCVCFPLLNGRAWTDSLPPHGHHNYSLSVIHAGSCSAKWDFPGDYSVTLVHVFCLCCR